MHISNRRRNSRISLSRMVGVTFPGNIFYILPTKNISVSGVFIKSKQHLPPGSDCSISLSEYWSGVKNHMEFKGVVRRKDEEGIAIEFTKMNEETYALLQTILLYESSNPLTMGEEFARGYPQFID